jgi:predicted dehydrogenase
MDKPLVRWGILGCANIARKNWKAIWNSQNGFVSAVASRDLQRSRRFIEECQAHAPFTCAPRALGSYEELLAADDVDAVYVPLPTGIRAEWVKQAAEAGKHVVCEKPCAINVTQLAKMLSVCQRNRVQFMDGVMFMHSQRLRRIGEVLEGSQIVGRIRRITSAFTFRAGEEFFASNIRSQSNLEPDGCLGDLGWYCIRFALWAMHWRLPRQVKGQVLSEIRRPGNDRPVPIEFSAELFFEDGVTSSFYCSFLTENEQWVNVSGERGHLRLADFVLPFSGTKVVFETGCPTFDVRGCDFEMQPRRRQWVVKECSHSDPTSQESRLFHNFAAQIQSGTLNLLWPEMALKTQQVLDACRESASVDGQATRSAEGISALSSKGKP